MSGAAVFCFAYLKSVVWTIKTDNQAYHLLQAQHSAPWRGDFGEDLQSGLLQDHPGLWIGSHIGGESGESQGGHLWWMLTLSEQLSLSHAAEPGQLENELWSVL